MDDDERALHTRVIDALEDTLRASNDVCSFSIEVTRDVVVVSGQVDNARQRSRIERTVRAVAGVTEVDNRLIIR